MSAERTDEGESPSVLAGTAASVTTGTGVASASEQPDASESSSEPSDTPTDETESPSVSAGTAASVTTGTAEGSASDEAESSTEERSDEGEDNQMKDPRDIILAPVVSEKSYALMETGVYTFKVHPSASKPEIRDAVQSIWGVEVYSVNTFEPRRQASPHTRHQPGRLEAGGQARHRHALGG